MQSFMHIAKSKDGVTVRQSDVFSRAMRVIFLVSSTGNGEVDDPFGFVNESKYKRSQQEFGKSRLIMRQGLKV
jgi:hypothetical protein